MSTLAAPTTWVESIGRLRLPGRTDQRLRDLMDRNNEGRLDPDEREQLESLNSTSDSRFKSAFFVSKKTR